MDWWTGLGPEGQAAVLGVALMVLNQIAVWTVPSYAVAPGNLKLLVPAVVALTGAIVTGNWFAAWTAFGTAVAAYEAAKRTIAAARAVATGGA